MANKIYYYELAEKKGISFETFLKAYLKEGEGRKLPMSLNEPVFHFVEKFIEMLTLIKKEGKKVAIVGDYDVDGILATYIMSLLLKYLGIPYVSILPNRFTDGYGLSTKLVDRAIENECSVIVTVDNGIVAFEACEYAKKQNIQVIVTDHHLPSSDGRLPNADLIIAPTLKNDNIKAPNICGAFTAFLLARDVIREAKGSERIIQNMAEIAGLATLADQMDLQYENLKIVKYLMSRIKKQKFSNKGLKVLAQIMNIKLINATEEDLLFSIIPALNATGRMETAEIALNLLTENEPKNIVKICSKIIELNNYRKSYSRKYADILINRISDKDINCTISVLDPTRYDKEIDKDLRGIVGIISANIVEVNNKPNFTFFKTKDGHYHGSGRSIEGFDLHEFVNSHKDEFEVLKMGGHSGAMGITIADEENLDKFRKALNQEKVDLPDVVKPYIKLSTTMNFEEIFEIVNKYGPYGPSHQKPIFVIETTPQNGIIFGKKHLQFNVTIFGNLINCIYFFNTELDEIKDKTCNIFFSFTKDSSNKLQLNIEKIEPKEK